MTVKMADKSGRVSLPKGFEGQTLIVEQISETEVVIKKARVIPEREVWLWQNPVAIGMVQQGIEEAKSGALVAGPDLDADADADDEGE